MIKRPINARFSEAVREGRKFTTIRSKPWPCWKPIMLYNWSGAAYRSKQIDVAAIEVEEVLEMVVSHDEHAGIVFCRDKIDGIPLHKTEGFDNAGQMQEWFAKVVPVGKTVELALMRFRLLNVQSTHRHQWERALIQAQRPNPHRPPRTVRLVMVAVSRLVRNLPFLSRR